MRSQSVRAGKIVAPGMRGILAVKGHTYLLRAVSFKEADVIVPSNTRQGGRRKHHNSMNFSNSSKFRISLGQVVRIAHFDSNSRSSRQHSTEGEAIDLSAS